ncbi:MAG: hypothetical protein M1838_002334 [Thelocarpon superellum]|nr:MAG: hypothetical protein M1838_002334 [Thelocarpon superellum]
MTDFKLAALLEGHEDDVRGVSFAKSDLVLSASRDATVRAWKLIASAPPAFDGTVSSHGSAFVNSIAFLAPNDDYPDGLIVSGGKDTIIDVRRPGKRPDESAEALLLGHTNNVCSLDVDPKGRWIVSGSWDGDARVWKVGTWQCETILEGHQGSVWAVLAIDEKTIVTGCVDKGIRIFGSSGKLLTTILQAHEDVLRALCRIPAGHPSGAAFASASNDGLIRLWTMGGSPVGELRGHESFIYSLASLPTGELVSSGEDRTVRVWRGERCIQTITHPAISVWSVAACMANGDIVSGASDKVVRVFSRHPQRQATAATLAAFEESIKSSSIPQQQVGEVNKEKLPGPEFLQQKSGTKEGQVVMIREPNGAVTAHQWSTASSEWRNVGTVVDAVGSSGRKKDYLGQDYDYVFDVDIEDGAPPLKLPYNLSENPYEAATRFVQNNELPMTYLDQVTNFIVTNTQGATIGQSAAPAPAPAGADPWGSESRYRPGDAPAPPPPAAAPSRSKVLPQTTYLSIKQANLPTIRKKIGELNEQLIKDGDKELSLNPADLAVLDALIAQLEQAPAAAAKPSPAISQGLALVLRIISSWPSSLRLPGIDLLRLLAAATPVTSTYRDARGEDLVAILDRSGIFTDVERRNNMMLGIRAFANLFETQEGRALAEARFDEILGLTSPATSSSPNDRNTTIALTTLLINYAVLLTSPSHHKQAASSTQALALLDPLSTVIGTSLSNAASSAPSSEAAYRALVAGGTLLSLGDEVREAAGSVFGLKDKAREAAKAFSEPRITNVVEEVLALIK